MLDHQRGRVDVPDDAGTDVTDGSGRCTNRCAGAVTFVTGGGRFALLHPLEHTPETRLGVDEELARRDHAVTRSDALYDLDQVAASATDLDVDWGELPVSPVDDHHVALPRADHGFGGDEHRRLSSPGP